MQESQNKIFQLVVSSALIFLIWPLFRGYRAEILEKISLVFWKFWRRQKDISKLTDLYIISIQHCIPDRLLDKYRSSSTLKVYLIVWYQVSPSRLLDVHEMSLEIRWPTANDLTTQSNSKTDESRTIERKRFDFISPARTIWYSVMK